MDDWLHQCTSSTAHAPAAEGRPGPSGEAALAQRQLCASCSPCVIALEACPGLLLASKAAVASRPPRGLGPCSARHERTVTTRLPAHPAPRVDHALVFRALPEPSGVVPSRFAVGRRSVGAASALANSDSATDTSQASPRLAETPGHLLRPLRNAADRAPQHHAVAAPVPGGPAAAGGRRRRRGVDRGFASGPAGQRSPGADPGLLALRHPADRPANAGGQAAGLSTSCDAPRRAARSQHAWQEAD